MAKLGLGDIGGLGLAVQAGAFLGVTSFSAQGSVNDGSGQGQKQKQQRREGDDGREFGGGDNTIAVSKMVKKGAVLENRRFHPGVVHARDPKAHQDAGEGLKGQGAPRVS